MRPFLMSLAVLSVLGAGAVVALSGETGCSANAGPVAPVVTGTPDQMPATPVRCRCRSGAGCCWGDHYAPWNSAFTYPYWTFGYPRQSYYSRPSYENPAFGYYYRDSGRYHGPPGF